MIDQKAFLKKYNVTQEDYDATKLTWGHLEEIFNNYTHLKVQLQHSAELVFNTVMKFPGVHSVRYRLKDPEHLIEKIIRKKKEDSKSDINLDNYQDLVTDLVGVRALHLFKNQWRSIHEAILGMWNIKQRPVANYRKGDIDETIQAYKEQGCDTKEHKYGYRSVHYLIETQPAKQKIFAEIQVRTIYEEAWSEIDHIIRYPYEMDNPIFFQFLSILNRLSGGADEMGSYIQYLKSQLALREEEFAKVIDEKTQIITDLQTKIEKSNLKQQDINTIKEGLRKLKNPILSPGATDLATAIANAKSFYPGAFNFWTDLANPPKSNIASLLDAVKKNNLSGMNGLSTKDEI